MTATQSFKRNADVTTAVMSAIAEHFSGNAATVKALANGTIAQTIKLAVHESLREFERQEKLHYEVSNV